MILGQKQYLGIVFDRLIYKNRHLLPTLDPLIENSKYCFILLTSSPNS